MKKSGLVLLIVLALVVLGGLLYFLMPRDPNALPPSDWRTFRQRHIDSGRVVDDGNANISHSEGQGYGMLLAVAYEDRETFDQLWKWTRENLQTRGDALFAWKWVPSGDGKGSVVDPNNASDGDLLIAWALIRASHLWDEFSYLQEAATISADLRAKTLIPTPIGPVMLPGILGFKKEDGVVLNPSYFIPGAFLELHRAFPSENWLEVAEAGNTVIRQARFGKSRLSPDWAALQTSEPPEFTLDISFPPEFGYNAVRVPLYAGWHDPESPILKPFAQFWSPFLLENETPPATVNLENNEAGPHPALPGMVAIARFSIACQQGSPLTVSDLAPVSPEEPYYSAVLLLLTKLAIHESSNAEPTTSIRPESPRSVPTLPPQTPLDREQPVPPAGAASPNPPLEPSSPTTTVTPYPTPTLPPQAPPSPPPSDDPANPSPSPEQQTNTSTTPSPQ